MNHERRGVRLGRRKPGQVPKARALGPRDRGIVRGRDHGFSGSGPLPRRRKAEGDRQDARRAARVRGLRLSFAWRKAVDPPDQRPLYAQARGDPL